VSVTNTGGGSSPVWTVNGQQHPGLAAAPATAAAADDGDAVLDVAAGFVPIRCACCLACVCVPSHTPQCAHHNDPTSTAVCAGQVLTCSCGSSALQQHLPAPMALPAASRSRPRRCCCRRPLPCKQACSSCSSSCSHSHSGWCLPCSSSSNNISRGR
jgi:hypothetical protein